MNTSVTVSDEDAATIAREHLARASNALRGENTPTPKHRRFHLLPRAGKTAADGMALTLDTAAKGATKAIDVAVRSVSDALSRIHASYRRHPRKTTLVLSVLAIAFVTAALRARRG